MDCIFCKMVKGEAPCHKLWEDEEHLAFLTIFPNTEGFTVVIPKKHYPSYAFDVPEEILVKLVLAAKKVGKLLDQKLDDVGRTGLIFEGFGVDHLHAKFFPMHGTKMKEWKPIHAKERTYFRAYPGFISSHDGERVDDTTLAALAKKIKK
jgi:histidine triad (HIT) family protein